jgi:3-oxoacyl-[acyl-carrier protein] reductase
MTVDRFKEIKIGDEAEILHTITAKDVETFVDLTGDDNPLHVNDDYAASTSYKKRVVHGMLTASFISTIVGTKLPGKGSLWYEQQLQFLNPVRIGEKIRVWVKIKQKSISQRIVVLETVIFGEGERKVVQGEVKIKVLPQKEKREMLMKIKMGAVIISGASRGIGATIAKALATEGYPVVVNYRQSANEAEGVVKEISANEGKAVSYRADVSDKRKVEEMVQFVLSKYQGIAGIVNNASGNITAKAFSDLVWDDIQKHMDIQLKGSFNLTQSVLPHLLSQQFGVIVNIASIVADNVPPVKWLHYNITKAALITFSKSLAAEYGPKGIRINCVSPGMTQTDLIADIPEKTKMITKMQTPLRRLADPDDIAGCVAFLFSEKASFITGQNIRICGGIVMS